MAIDPMTVMMVLSAVQKMSGQGQQQQQQGPRGPVQGPGLLGSPRLNALRQGQSGAPLSSQRYLQPNYQFGAGTAQDGGESQDFLSVLMKALGGGQSGFPGSLSGGMGVLGSLMQQPQFKDLLSGLMK